MLMYCAGSTVHTIPASRITCQVVQQTLYSTYLRSGSNLQFLGTRTQDESWTAGPLNTTIMLS